MSDWILRIIQVDKEQVPDFIDSKYYTDAPVNLFKVRAYIYNALRLSGNNNGP